MIDGFISVVRVMVLGMFLFMLVMNAFVYFRQESTQENKTVAVVWSILILLNLWLVIMAAKTGSIL